MHPMTTEQEYYFFIIYIMIVLVCFVLYHFGKFLFINRLDTISDWAYYILNTKKSVILKQINKLDKMEIQMLLIRINRKNINSRELWILMNIYDRPYMFQGYHKLEYLQNHIVRLKITEHLNKL